MEKTVTESESVQNTKAFIEDDYTRAEHNDTRGIITEISKVERESVLGTDYINLYIEEPEDAGKWSYEKADVITWDEDTSWLVEFANERGVTLETLDKLEGEPVFVHRDADEGSWYMKSTHPDEMFEEDDIETGLVTEGEAETLSETEPETSPEHDVLKHDKQGDYFNCPITEITEIERENACNLIQLTVDTPYDTGNWRFEKPYGWPEDNTLVQLAESRGYAEGNFTDLTGENVSVRRNGEEWELSIEHEPSTQTETEPLLTREQIAGGVIALITLLTTLSFLVAIAL